MPHETNTSIAAGNDRGLGRPSASAPARTSARSLAYEPALNGIRGVAVLLVVATHVRLLAPKLYGTVLPKGGFLGVDAFFVLSGFLITALLLREQAVSGRIRLGAFYRRRALRLLPALVLFVCVHVVYAWATTIPAALERRSLLSVGLYSANWKIVYGRGWPLIAPGLAHLWSLAVEEQYYIVWPLLVIAFLGSARRLSTVAYTITAAILVIAVWRAVLVSHDPPGIVYFRTDARADALLVGALCAHLWSRRRIPSRRALIPLAWLSLAFVAVCATAVESNNRFYFFGGFTAVAVAVAVILLAVLESDWAPRRPLSSTPLRAVGRVSYGVYLWHYFVFFGLSEHTETWNTGVRVLVGLSLTTACTSLSWFLVERPCLSWKSRLESQSRLRHALGSQHGDEPFASAKPADGLLAASTGGELR